MNVRVGLSSSCPLAAIGYSRDQKRNKPQVNYGLLTDRRGCPVAISVHAGNVADSETFGPLVQRVRNDFGVQQLVLVGDRGMISQRAIAQLREQPGIDWISALKSVSTRTLVKRGQLPLARFDETNLFELYSPDYPGERLIACRNRALATRRAHKRQALLEATEANLKAIRDRVRAGRLSGSDAIGVQVGKVINQYKVGKHFELTITERTFRFQRRAERIEAEAALDGVYLIRTSLADATMDASACVRSYKALTQVERAFRSIKSIDLKVRPIHHRLETRVRAHLFVCMLAYYLEWHMREAWRELTFADTELEAKATRDPVAPARRSASARHKAATATLDDGTPAHSFQTLLGEMGTLVRNTCQATANAAQPQHFELDTCPNPKQRRAFELLDQIHV